MDASTDYPCQWAKCYHVLPLVFWLLICIWSDLYLSDLSKSFGVIILCTCHIKPFKIIPFKLWEYLDLSISLSVKTMTAFNDSISSKWTVSALSISSGPGSTVGHFTGKIRLMVSVCFQLDAYSRHKSTTQLTRQHQKAPDWSNIRVRSALRWAYLIRELHCVLSSFISLALF